MNSPPPLLFVCAFVASSTVMRAHGSRLVTDALLIGGDLGPNLSITGSLATILWLNALWREGEDVSVMTRLKVGAVLLVSIRALHYALAHEPIPHQLDY
jgi:arsenical pump membrane protein